jgi:hypothetical protein
MWRKKPIESRGARLAASRHEHEWKSCTQTRESGSQFAMIVSAKRSFTST